jgi:cytochrome c biogenesis protein CcmG/thiol:disulfide interchange protein DsbE
MTGRLKLVAQGLAVCAVVALLALLVWKVAFADGGGAAKQLAEGKNPVAPTFVLERLDTEGLLNLRSLRGKAIVLNFWASWCIPCKDEAPVLQQTYEKYKQRGLVVLGVNTQDFRGDARRFMKRFGLTYPVVFDGKGSTLGRYGVTGFPETYFVDRTGKLVGTRIAGGIDIERNEAEFRRGIQLALGQR